MAFYSITSKVVLNICMSPGCITVHIVPQSAPCECEQTFWFAKYSIQLLVVHQTDSGRAFRVYTVLDHLHCTVSGSWAKGLASYGPSIPLAAMHLYTAPSSSSLIDRVSILMAVCVPLSCLIVRLSTSRKGTCCIVKIVHLINGRKASICEEFPNWIPKISWT